MAEAALAVMAKRPEVGATKTRLCPPLTAAEAAALYEAMLLDTLALGAGLAEVDLAVAITPPEAQGYFERIAPPGTRLLPVTCAEIGGCLSAVMHRLSGLGYAKVLAMNSDGPSLPAEYLRTALARLDDCDLVLGPGEDGGYYVIGWKRPHTGVFQGIEWSTERVLAQSVAQAERLGLRVELLPAWYDVDTGDDLRRLADEAQRLPPERLAHTRRALAGMDPSRW